MDKLASIIIRTKNEEKWIGICLRSVFEQDYPNFEVVIVDDNSEDRTLEIVGQYPAKVVNYDLPYLPGLSLNTGIRASKGDCIVCLSGHCVPVNNTWLSNLLRNLDVENAAGVYGRQEPLPYSADTDKRDLWTVFGLDRKVQKRDSFFHNANSAMTRRMWEEVPFDEQTTNIEDRIWAREVLNRGYEIIYEPEASVYHWHGIHQDGNRERLRNVVKIVESLDLVSDQEAVRGDPTKLNIVAVIPKKGESLKVNDRRLISYSIERALEAELIDEVIVSTDSEKTAELALSLGADAPFIRPQELSQDYIGLNRVMSYSISQLQMLGRFADLVIILQETNPFRPKGFLDALIREALYTGVDTLIPVRRDYRMFFKEEEKELVAIDSGLIPQKFKDPLFAGIAGLGMVVKPALLLDEQLTGKHIGIFPVRHRLSPLDIENREDAAYFGKLLETFWESDE